MLRFVVGIASLCGLVVFGGMALFMVGMGGFGNGHATSHVGALLFVAGLLGLFHFPFVVSIRNPSAEFIRIGMVVTPICSLPFFAFLFGAALTGVDRTIPVVVFAALGVFVALFLLMGRLRLQNHAQQSPPTDA